MVYLEKKKKNHGVGQAFHKLKKNVLYRVFEKKNTKVQHKTYNGKTTTTFSYVNKTCVPVPGRNIYI